MGLQPVLSHVWLVEFAVRGPLAEITLTFSRRMPNGAEVKFDMDRDGLLDLATDQHERLVMDGMLALIPEGELISCGLRETQRAFLVFDSLGYRHVFADHDRSVVAAEFDGGIWNPDSSPDLVFVGGRPADHSADAIVHAAQRLARTRPPADDEPVREVLSTYAELIVVNGAVVRVRRPAEVGREFFASAEAALSNVAAKYGYALPSQQST
ncbi:MAG TPA: hypothetical protein VKV73_30260 [Chloroflexota bacterium]|nr:hypothetical protein [Chloroflexota bacterium]